MQKTGYLDALAVDGAAFAAAAERAPLDAPVPGCPEWNVADLVWHLSKVHEFWRQIVAGPLSDPAGMPREPRPAEDQALLGRYRDGLTALRDTLSAADPQLSCWTWSDDHTAGFVQRRMAQETAVHRWDAESVAGDPAPIEAGLATDGIDEFVTHFRAEPAEPPLAVRLVCTDIGAEFNLHAGSGPPAGTLRGSAFDLLLVLWGRFPVDRVHIDGDSEAVTAALGATARE